MAVSMASPRNHHLFLTSHEAFTFRLHLPSQVCKENLQRLKIGSVSVANKDGLNSMEDLSNRGILGSPSLRQYFGAARCWRVLV